MGGAHFFYICYLSDDFRKKNFSKYDRDGNGYITLREASEVLRQAPYNFPPGKIVQLLKTFDKDGNGKLSIDEFVGFYADAKAL